MERLKYILYRLRIFLQFRKYHAIFLLAVTILGIWLLWLGTAGFNKDINAVLLNISTDVLSLVFAYLLFDSTIQRIEQDRIREHPELDITKLFNRISNLEGEAKVRILSTWTDLLTIADYKKRFVPLITAGVRKGITFEFLLLDPRSVAVPLRQQDLGAEYDVEQNIRNNIKEIDSIVASLTDEKLKRRIRLRLYDRAPTVSFNMVNKHAFVSFFPLNKSSTQSNQLEVAMRTQFGEFLNSTFNDMWEKSKDRDLNSYFFLQIKNVPRQQYYECMYVKRRDEYYINSYNIAGDLIGKTIPPRFQILIDSNYIACKLHRIEQDSEASVHQEIKVLFENKHNRSEGDLYFRVTIDS